jgi:hypothetical protein
MGAPYGLFVRVDMVLDGTVQVNAAGILLAGGKTCLWPTMALIQTATTKQLKAEVDTYDQRMGEVMRAFEAQQPFARCEKQAWQHLIAG